MLSAMVGLIAGCITGAVCELIRVHGIVWIAAAVSAGFASVVFWIWIARQYVLCDGYRIEVYLWRTRRTFLASEIVDVQATRNYVCVFLTDRRTRVRMPDWIWATSKVGRFVFAAAAINAVPTRSEHGVGADPLILLWQGLCS
jgi:hypothetical protein